MITFVGRVGGAVLRSASQRFRSPSTPLPTILRYTKSTRTAYRPTMLRRFNHGSLRLFHSSSRILQYQRFSNQRRGGIPIFNLYHRWAARPTFYYEVGGVGALVGGVYLYNVEEVPVSGRRRFNIVSDKWMQDLSNEQAGQIMQQYRDQLLPEWDDRSVRVNRVLQRLIPSSGLSNAEWEVHVIDSPEANAFVLPGGKVFVFSGILPICGDDNGIAAVLGHEIAHNVARHSSEKMSQSVILTVAFIAMQQLIGIPDIASNLLLTLAFERPGSRAQESEADYIGLLMMAQSCFPPEAAEKLWTEMERREKEHPQPPQLMSTHPSHHNRQLKIHEWLPKAREKYEQSNCSITAQYVSDFRSRFSPSWS